MDCMDHVFRVESPFVGRQTVLSGSSAHTWTSVSPCQSTLVYVTGDLSFFFGPFSSESVVIKRRLGVSFFTSFMVFSLLGLIPSQTVMQTERSVSSDEKGTMHGPADSDRNFICGCHCYHF